MDNQHRKIGGYRELTQEEIDLMNEAKQLEAKCLAFHKKVCDYLESPPSSGLSSDSERERRILSGAYRWHAIARTDIETGFMALVRSIAQPQPVELDT